MEEIKEVKTFSDPLTMEDENYIANIFNKADKDKGWVSFDNVDNLKSWLGL